MDVIRTIHPVGQGGFYTESFHIDGVEHMVVYDCGGNSKQSMEEYLKKYIHDPSPGQRMQIDAVFISHLHADHVNGLEYLLENADVKMLILPQLTEEMVIEALVYNYCHVQADGKEMNRLILELYGGDGFFRERPVIQVLPAEPEQQVEEEGDRISLLDLCERTNNTDIKSGTQLFLATSPWLFIPYNPPVKRNGSDLRKVIKERFKLSGDITVENLPRIAKGRIRQLRSIYADCFGKNHNSYSMTLFSGVWHPRDLRFNWYTPFRLSPNCLYTGDFEPSVPFMDYLMAFYRHLWKSIKSVQVPHHGSRENFNQALYEYAVNGFLSVGEKNRYHHPNIDTLISIHKNECFPVIVTEDLNTMKVYHFEQEE